MRNQAHALYILAVTSCHSILCNMYFYICFYRWYLWLFWGEDCHVFCLAGILHHFHVVSCCDRICVVDAHWVWSGEKRSYNSLKKLQSPIKKGHLSVCVVSDESWHLLRGVCTVQRGVGHSVSGAVEEEGGWAGIQVGNTGYAVRIAGGTTASVPGERNKTSDSFFHLHILFALRPNLNSLSPSFCQGVKRCSPITGCEEFYYPPWRRRVFRWLVSLPICILCLCFVFLVMLICFELQVGHAAVSICFLRVLFVKM